MRENRPGFLNRQNHGTLLLDEINSMNISLQAKKALRVLQDGIRRIGGSEIKVDVRVLSSASIFLPIRPLPRLSCARTYFYRLGVININIPPLRERKEDIALLATYQ